MTNHHPEVDPRCLQQIHQHNLDRRAQQLRHYRLAQSRLLLPLQQLLSERKRRSVLLSRYILQRRVQLGKPPRHQRGYLKQPSTHTRPDRIFTSENTEHAWIRHTTVLRANGILREKVLQLGDGFGLRGRRDEDAVVVGRSSMLESVREITEGDFVTGEVGKVG